MRSLAALSVACVLFSSPALAQTLDQATANQLAAELNTSFIQAFASNGDDIKLDAPLTASITTDAYLINVPSMTISLRDKLFLKLPATTALLRPVGTDSYTYESTFPNPVSVLTADQQPAGEITIRHQKVSGSWKRGAYGPSAFPLTDIKLSDVLYKDALDVELIKVTQLNVNHTSSLSEAGKLNQSTVSKASEIVMRDNSGLRAASLAELGLEVYLIDADAAALENARKNAQEMKPSLAPAPLGLTPEAIAKTTSASVLEALGQLSVEFGKAGGSRLVKIRLTNLATLDKSGPAQKTFRLATLAFGGEVKPSPTTGLMTYNTIYRHDGLELSPPPSDLVVDFMPKILSLNLSLENLPLARLMEVAAQALKLEAGDTTLPATSVESASAQAQAALTQAGTTLKINEMAGMTAELAGTMKGQLTATQTSPLGVNGELNGVIKGLDEYINNLKVLLLASQKAGDTETLMENRNLFLTLNMLQTMGTPMESAKGSSRQYNIVFTPEGAVTINGSPLPLPTAQ